MDEDSDEIFYDALGWQAEDPEIDYDDRLDRLLFPPPTGDLPIPSQRPTAAGSSFYDQYTAALRSTHSVGPPVHERVKNSLLYMQLEQGLNLTLFLEALFWGEPECISDPKIAHERTVFMKSPALVHVLDQLWCPPTGAQYGGGDRMKDFVLNKATEVLSAELHEVATTVYRVPKGQDPLTKDYLTSIDLRRFGTSLQTTAAPRLWFLLQSLAYTDWQILHNTMKNAFHVILAIISMLAFSRSHDSCVITMVWSIYLKACGLSARAFDALHALGLTMSHKWTCDAFAKIARAAKANTQRAIALFPHFGSHDNVNIPMRVFSQRLHNQNHFINATAATIYILPLEAFLPPDIAARARAQRREGAKKPFLLKELYHSPAEDARRARVAAQARYRILRFLLESPEFAGYEHAKDPLLSAPPPVDLLPCGPEHTVQQHILETVEVDESTYDGTDQLLHKIFPNAMGLGSPADMERIGRTGLIPWIGDQLTVERIRGLGRIRHDAVNSWGRMEWIEPNFGFFHAEMAYANSLHAQYLGTSTGLGLRKAFELLRRKGLTKVDTKGIFWQNLDDALWHIGEGNFLALWLTVGKVDNLRDLTGRTPAELVALAEDIYDNHASRAAHQRMTDLPANEQDDVKRQMTMFSADVLGYFDLREAIRIGDVGRMEDLLPVLLFRFLGGGNHKYATEILELLQKIKCEWPEELRVHMRRHCWVVNFTGARDGFVAVDMAQEHNVKDIKVTWSSFGPGATFSYIQKISPAIPVLRAIKEAFAAQFPAIRGRGRTHGAPSKDKDVQRIIQMYQDAKAHTHIPNAQRGREGEVMEANRALDYMSIGASRLSTEGKFQAWWEERTYGLGDQEMYSMDVD